MNIKFNKILFVEPDKITRAKLKGTAATVASLCIVCTLFFMASGCGRQESVPAEEGDGFYYVNEGKKQFYSISKDKVILKTKSETDAKNLCKHPVFLGASDIKFTHEDIDGWVIAIIDPQKTKLNDLMQIPEVVDATYAINIGPCVYYPTDMISVGFQHGYSPDHFVNHHELGESVKSIKQFFKDDPQIHIITFNAKMGDIIEISRRLYETGWFEFAMPIFFGGIILGI